MVITTPVAPNGGPAPNGEGGPSAAPANGGGRLIDGIDPNYLHVNPYPNTAAPGPDHGVRGRQRDRTRAASRRSATSPGNQGTETDDQRKAKK